MAFEIIRRWLSLCLIVLATLIWFVAAAVVALDANNSPLARLVGLALSITILTVGAIALDQWSKHYARGRR